MKQLKTTGLPAPPLPLKKLNESGAGSKDVLYL